jgi:hypothetical protein
MDGIFANLDSNKVLLMTVSFSDSEKRNSEEVTQTFTANRSGKFCLRGGLD